MGHKRNDQEDATSHFKREKNMTDKKARKEAGIMLSRPDAWELYPRSAYFNRIQGAHQLLKSIGLNKADFRLLFVGGGTGMEAEYWIKQYKAESVIVSDISIEEIKLAIRRSQNRNLSFCLLVANAVRLPFCNGSIDIVVANDVLHHLPHPYEGIAEIWRVAKHCVIFNEPLTNRFYDMLAKLGITWRMEYSGTRPVPLHFKQVLKTFGNVGIKYWKFKTYFIFPPYILPLSLYNNPFINKILHKLGSFLAIIGLGNFIVGIAYTLNKEA